MRTRDLIAKPKRLIEAGRWSQIGATKGMPKSAFPLSKTRSFQLGRNWGWRVDRVSVDSLEGRLLTAFEPAKEKALAWLSVERADGHVIVTRYEFHGFDEPGWHCHSMCCQLSQIPVAVVKPFGTVRIPAARSRHRRQTFEITETSALALSFKFFRVSDRPEDALV